MRSAVLTVGLCLLAGGCASVIKGSTQSIAISTPPTTEATCQLSSSQGNWMVVSPGVATVDKSKEDIQARCTKPGWQDAAATIPSNFEGWTIGNILLGGIIGVGVDAATGAINDYPHTFQIPMTPLYGAAPVAPPLTPPVATAPPVASLGSLWPAPQPANATLPTAPIPVATQPKLLTPSAQPPSQTPAAAASPSTPVTAPVVPALSNPTAVSTNASDEYEQARRQYEQAEQLYESKLQGSAAGKPPQ